MKDLLTSLISFLFALALVIKNSDMKINKVFFIFDN